MIDTKCLKLNIYLILKYPKSMPNLNNFKIYKNNFKLLRFQKINKSVSLKFFL